MEGQSDDVVRLRIWSPAADIEKNDRKGEERGGFYSLSGPLIVDERDGPAHDVG